MSINFVIITAVQCCKILGHPKVKSEEREGEGRVIGTQFARLLSRHCLIDGPAVTCNQSAVTVNCLC